MSSLLGNTGSRGPYSGQRIAGRELAQIPNKTPGQMQMHDEAMGAAQPGITQGLDYYSRLAGGDQSMFDQLEAPALRQFGQMQGQTASRFSGAGVGGRNSSGHQLAQGGLAQTFAEQLQGQRMALQQHGVSGLMDMYKQLMGDDMFDTFDINPAQRKKSKWESLLRGGLPVLGAIGGGILGGPAGAVAGGTVGNTLGSSFYDDEMQQPDFSSMVNLPTKWGS